MKLLRKIPIPRQRQRGAAFIVMLVIMIMGATFYLVSALSKVTLQTARNEASSDMLAQAKEVVIGNAIAGISGQQPGNVLRPDVLSTTESPRNYDGKAESGCLNANDPTGMAVPSMATISGGANTALMRCLGRLPWNDYKLPITSPSDSDPTGFMPWYAVSANLVDPTCVTSTYNAGFNPECAAINPSRLALNSELLNSATPPHPWLTVRDMKGNVLSPRVAFVIIIPGAPLNGQVRSASPNLGGANQYLDSITVPVGCTAPCVPGTYSNADLNDDFITGDEHRWIDDPANPGKQIEDPNYAFNDRLIYVTIDELMPLIEKRIAREAKKCLDDYAASSSNKYPWAAPITDLTYTTTANTLFGRIPDAPMTSGPLSPSNTSDPNVLALFNAIASLQNAANTCAVSYSSANQDSLGNAGAALVSAVNAVNSAQPTSPPIPSTTISPAITAGNKAQEWDRCWKIRYDGSTSVQNNLATTLSNLSGITVTSGDVTMSAAWPAGCFSTAPMSNYWGDWKRLVLYQLADGYKPGTATPACGSSCLSINGSGNPSSGSGSYRAAISIAGKMLPSQTRAAQSVDQYLELNNQTNKTATPSNLTFDTYKPADPSYSSVNDLVLCLDGKNNCK